ncbi:unnamed protein product [Protopolystoma xenopodis]|uniref:DBP10 C-terminal domain-containing protein n=1 Tax=Protopolystoma xenopodis TaxID=117903 RepID=A0A3S5CQV3_9PLAT|nr:unnamed protein product [Protopolystoma xenopodis]
MKKVRTESGVWIPASYKTDKYEHWLKQNKIHLALTSNASKVDSDCTAYTSRGPDLPKPKPADDVVAFSTRFGGVLEFQETNTSKNSAKWGRNVRTTEKPSPSAKTRGINVFGYKSKREFRI